MWSEQRVWEEGNCPTSLLFEGIILKQKLIIFSEQTFQQLQLQQIFINCYGLMND